MLTLLDTGCRIDEVLSLRVEDCDMDNLLLTVNGKGRKQRRVPFSFELRRVLSRYVADYCKSGDAVLFGTQRGKFGQAKCFEGCEAALQATWLRASGADAAFFQAHIRGLLL